VRSADPTQRCQTLTGEVPAELGAQWPAASPRGGSAEGCSDPPLEVGYQSALVVRKISDEGRSRSGGKPEGSRPVSLVLMDAVSSQEPAWKRVRWRHTRCH
jgi:hypothetical protein